MNALRRVWEHFEEGFIAFLLAAMTLITFVYVILNNFYTLFYWLGDYFGGNEFLLGIGDGSCTASTGDLRNRGNQAK
ncbi:C4-dicarboxylate TRAP transporter small permease protein DctQ (fragment) [Pseudomonas sp. 8O]